jgi:hypothetical protein
MWSAEYGRSLLLCGGALRVGSWGASCSGAGVVSLVRALEPNGHPGWRFDGDQPVEKPITATFGGNVMLQAVRATRRDDLLDLISCIELELPADTLCIGRLFGRRLLKPDDRFPMPDSQKAGKLITLIDAFETEQLVERPLGVLVGDIHDRVQLHSLMFARPRIELSATGLRWRS